MVRQKETFTVRTAGFSLFLRNNLLFESLIDYWIKEIFTNFSVSVPDGAE